MSKKTKTIILSVLTGLLMVVLIAAAITEAINGTAPTWACIATAVLTVGLLVLDVIGTVDEVKKINAEEKAAAEEAAKAKTKAASKSSTSKKKATTVKASADPVPADDKKAE